VRLKGIKLITSYSHVIQIARERKGKWSNRKTVEMPIPIYYVCFLEDYYPKKAIINKPSSGSLKNISSQ